MSAQHIEVDARDVMESDYDTFAMVPEWLLDEASPRAVVLFAMLLRYADKGGKAWPSRDRLSLRLKCSLATVDRLVRELVDLGVVTVEKRRRGAGWEHNVYRLTSRRRMRVTSDDYEPPTRVTSDDRMRVTHDDQCASPTTHEPEPLNESQSEREPEGASLRSVPAPAEKPKRKRSSSQGTRLPEDWQPSPDDVAYAQQRGLDPAYVAERFRGYWWNVPGSRGRKLNWSLAWKTWCRDERPRPVQVGGKLTQATTDACRAGRMRVNL